MTEISPPAERDPGRNHLPKAGPENITSNAVRTTREIEDTEVRNTSVWRVTGYPRPRPQAGTCSSPVRAVGSTPASQAPAAMAAMKISELPRP